MNRSRKMATNVLMAFFLMLSAFFTNVHAQVSLPNGDFSESVEELRVKTINGFVSVNRSYFAGRWQFNTAWNSLKFERDAVDNSVKTITRNNADFARTGDGWAFGNREVITKASVAVIPPANTAPLSGLP